MNKHKKMGLDFSIDCVGNVAFDYLRRLVKTVREEYESIKNVVLINELINSETNLVLYKIIKEINLMYNLDYNDNEDWFYFMGRVMAATENLLLSQEYFQNLARDEHQDHMITIIFSYISTQLFLFHFYGKKIEYDTENIYGIASNNHQEKLYKMNSLFDYIYEYGARELSYTARLKKRDMKDYFDVFTYQELLKYKANYIRGHHEVILYINKIWQQNLKTITENINKLYPSYDISEFLENYDDFYNQGNTPFTPKPNITGPDNLKIFFEKFKQYIYSLEKKYYGLKVENQELIENIKLIRFFIKEIPLIEVTDESITGITSFGVYNTLGDFPYIYVRGEDIDSLKDPLAFNDELKSWQFRIEHENNNSIVLKLDEAFELISPLPPYDPRSLEKEFQYNHMLGIAIDGNPYCDDLKNNATFFGLFIYEKIKNIILSNLFDALNSEFLDLEKETITKEVLETKSGQYIVSLGKANFQAKKIAQENKVKLEKNNTLTYITNNVTPKARHQATEGLRYTLKIKKYLREKGLTLDIFDKNLLIQILTKLGCKLNKKKGKGSHITFEKGNYNSTLHNKNVNLPWVTKNLLPKLHIEPEEFAICLLKIKKIKCS